MKKRDQNKELNLSVCSAEIPEINTFVKLSYDENFTVRIGIDKNPNIPSNVLVELANYIRIIKNSIQNLK